MNYSVYMHITPSMKRYIGITSGKPEIRWGTKGRYYKNQIFYRAIQKYGWDNIQHIIVATNLTKEQAGTLECNLIKQYKTTNKKFGYNVSTGGEFAFAGIHRTEKWRKNISKSQMGNKSRTGMHNSLEHKEKLRLANLGNTYGKAKSIPVLQFTLEGKFIKEYSSATEAANELGLSRSHICQTAKGKHKHCGGYIWKRKGH